MRSLKYILTIIFAFAFTLAKADEGMWLPQLLQKLNESRMKSLGMKISAKDIYSINQGSLKDAVVSFGGFCTGEVISSKGLVLTNHHCGFDAIQNHSSLQNNYIRDGFWAKNNKEEIANPALFVTFIVRIDDVTTDAMKGVSAGMSESERQSAIDKNINEIKKNVKKESSQESFVRGFFEGNQYYQFVTETYKDVRLVGAPPSSIGNFGKDTDNWMWPRHTGDFSMFRIYAGKNNKPADYSTDNIPYVPKKSFSISLDGVSEGDFTMVFGFPGRTMEYLHSSAVEQVMKVSDPAKIAIRAKALQVIDGYMRKDEQIKIQYAAKYAGIQNAYKKWQGEILGLTAKNAVEKKKMYEATFQQRVNANPEWKNKYGSILTELETAYKDIQPYGLARDYYTEITSKIELFTIVAQLNSLVNTFEKEGEAGYQKRLPLVKKSLMDLYGEYNGTVDMKLFEVLMEMYVKDQEAGYVSPLVNEMYTTSGKQTSGIASSLYKSGVLSSNENVTKFLEGNSADVVNQLKEMQLVKLHNNLIKTYQGSVQGKFTEKQNLINKLQRTYMQAQMEVMKEKMFYPDANSTLRLTYGTVQGYAPRDAVKFSYYTDLDGLMEKYKPGDYEFDVPEKLQTLWRNKDYGQYGKNGIMPVCFIASNHTTGGNSGSPALDAFGNLIGLNFDRVWEGTMSDINYDPSICRNIMVDIRYVLFIVDKYAGASHLVNEMKLVHPKSKTKKN
ncbi:MAG: S46 family peptidase [Ferruginibacter sp.]